MGWFNKKEKEEKKQEIPSLPELPKLPELPNFNNDEEKDFLEKVPQLPSFPNNDLGKKFSQDTIKDVISGKKEGDEVFNVDESEIEEKFPMIPKPQKEFVPLKKSSPMKTEEFEEVNAKASTKMEPIFIRLDKFEESLKTFEKAKHQISEIEKMLKNIKELKIEEEQELEQWESQIQSTKQQIEKVDKNIFSKI